MVSFFSVVMISLIAAVASQRSPYAGSSDPGVHPIYQQPGTDNRFGEEETSNRPNNAVHPGTLQTEDLYNRVSEWPEDRKPFWYLNAMAVQQHHGGQQPPTGQMQPSRNRQSRFSSSRRS